MATEWMDNLLNNKISKEAMESQGTDKQDHFDRKVVAHPWVNDILDLDPVTVEAEYREKLKQEAMTLGKTAALDDVIADGVTPEEVMNRDYKRDVSSLSDYALAEMLAEARGHKAQNTSEMFYELKEKAKAEVASSREKAEKALLDLIPESSMLDWQKAFKEFTKDATPAEAKEKDLFKSDVPEKAHDFQHPTEEKFKLPKDKEEAIPGNGREADERTEVTEEAGVLKKDITEGTGKEASLKTAIGDNLYTPTKHEMNQKFNVGDKVSYNFGGSHKGQEAVIVDVRETGDLKKYGWTCVVKFSDGTTEEVNENWLSPTEEAAVLKADITEGLGKQAEFQPKTGEPCSCKPGVARDNCPSCEGTGQKVDFKQIRDKKADVDNKIQFHDISLVDNPLDPNTRIKRPKLIYQDDSMVDNGGYPIDKSKIVDKEADGPSASDNCPVCDSVGVDLANGEQENMACQGCGITYGSFKVAEIESHASKAEVIKKIAELNKKAEVASSWEVRTDEQGNEVIARVGQPTNIKESEEVKPDELLK